MPFSLRNSLQLYQQKDSSTEGHTRVVWPPFQQHWQVCNKFLARKQKDHDAIIPSPSGLSSSGRFCRFAARSTSFCSKEAFANDEISKGIRGSECSPQIRHTSPPSFKTESLVQYGSQLPLSFTDISPPSWTKMCEYPKLSPFYSFAFFLPVFAHPMNQLRDLRMSRYNPLPPMFFHQILQSWTSYYCFSMQFPTPSERIRKDVQETLVCYYSTPSSCCRYKFPVSFQSA